MKLKFLKVNYITYTSSFTVSEYGFMSWPNTLSTKYQNPLKGHVVVDRTSWSIKQKHLKPFVMKCIWLERCCKSIKKNWSTQVSLKTAQFSFYVRTNTVGHMGVNNLTLINGRHVSQRVKRKPRNFEACLCRSLYSTFTTSFFMQFTERFW